MALHRTMPPNVHLHIALLADQLRKSGFPGAQVAFNLGEPTHCSLFDEDGEQTFFWCKDGEWYLHEEEAD